MTVSRAGAPGEGPGARALAFAGEFVDSEFRRGAEANRHVDGAHAAVDTELRGAQAQSSHLISPRNSIAALPCRGVGVCNHELEGRCTRVEESVHKWS